MIRKHWLLLVIGIMILLGVCFEINNTVNFGEKLPITILQENILYGQIAAYHPDIFYMKYGLKFAEGSDIFKGNLFYLDDNLGIAEYFYYAKEWSNLPVAERNILKSDLAQTYIKISGNDETNYLFTMSGDASGSANFRDLTVKLYRLDNGRHTVVFDKTETYSIDPGIDSNYFAERLKLLIYRKLHLDDRYL